MTLLVKLIMKSKLFIKDKCETYFCRIYQKGNGIVIEKWEFEIGDYSIEEFKKSLFIPLKKAFNNSVIKIMEEGYIETNFSEIMVQVPMVKLNNPEIELSYILIEIIEEELRNTGNGFSEDYTIGEKSENLNLYFKVIDPYRAMESIEYILSGKEIMGNDIMVVSLIAIKEEGGYKIIFPDYYSGNFCEE